MSPVAPVKIIEDRTEPTIELVVDAVTDSIIVVEAYGNCEAAAVEEAMNIPFVQIDVVVASVVVENEFNGVTVNS